MQNEETTFAASDEVKEYLQGVIGVVDANSYETMCLWHESKQNGHSWVSTGHGFGVTVGYLAGMPVCIMILTATVRGHKILFIDPTSQVVDWRLIDTWLKKNLPETAKKGESYNETNAMNFPNIFPRKTGN